MNNLFIISNESIFKRFENYYCDNIDLKVIPEELNKFFNTTLIGRNSKNPRSKIINLKKINLFKKNFFSLTQLFKIIISRNNTYLVISISPFTFFFIILLKLFRKKYFIYLRSDGYQEYKSIAGRLGVLIYHFMFTIASKNAHMISCRKHLLKSNRGIVISPSQLSQIWFVDKKKIDPKDIKLLYVGRLRVEKGIFSLIEIIKNSEFNLTILTSELNCQLSNNFKNIKLISHENYNDTIIKFYDQHTIFILPSYTEAHPQVLDEALARERPVIIFKDIEHVIRDRKGIFVCDRNLRSLTETINYITNNYEIILESLRKNKLPTKIDFLNDLKKILSTT